jgi:hypothetical protein
VQHHPSSNISQNASGSLPSVTTLTSSTVTPLPLANLCTAAIANLWHSCAAVCVCVCERERERERERDSGSHGGSNRAGGGGGGLALSDCPTSCKDYFSTSPLSRVRARSSLSLPLLRNHSNPLRILGCMRAPTPCLSLVALRVMRDRV